MRYRIYAFFVYFVYFFQCKMIDEVEAQWWKVRSALRWQLIVQCFSTALALKYEMAVFVFIYTHGARLA